MSEDRPALADVEPGEQVILLQSETTASLSAFPADAYDHLLVVAFRDSPIRIERRIRDHGGDPSTVTVIPVSGTEIDYDGPLHVTDHVSPSDLTGLAIRLSDELDTRPSGGWLYFRGLSVALMYVPPDRFFRFLDHAHRLAHVRDLRGVYEFYRAAISDDVYRPFRGLFDREIRLP